MLITAALLLGGLVLLVGGGEGLVRGASRLALLAKVPPAVVGLTIVAAGTSAPELMVSLSAAARGSADLSVGNVVGSNIYNIALILGMAALVRPLDVHGQVVKLEWPVMALASGTLFVLARDGLLDRPEGLLLVAGMVAFVAWQVRIARKGVDKPERDELELLSEAEDPGGGWGKAALFTAVGLGALLLGAELFVRGAIDVAREAGLSERVIGLTVVSLGTSLPELVTSVVASVRGHTDIAIANVVGSNIFNVLLILGLTSSMLPLAVAPGLISHDMPVMLALTVLLLPMLYTGMKVTRVEGGALVLLATGYTAWLLTGG